MHHPRTHQTMADAFMAYIAGMIIGAIIGYFAR